MSNNTRQDVEVLVVDDDLELSDTLREFLSAEGYAVGTANSASGALEFYSNHPELALALLDVVMPQGNGIELMEQLHQRNPDLPIVIMTGFATIETAVDAIKRGAEDYLTKPFDRDAVRKKVGRLMEVHRLRQRVAKLEADLGRSGDPFRELIFVSNGMQRVVERARTVAHTDATVLIVGETGTGKERLARAIHGASRRAGAEFVPVNCGALPRELIESELFGVRRGAYTTRVDTRIIAATNRTLQELRSNVLREDLYFRLATVVIEVPPLRARREDILVLSQWFVARLAEKYGRHVTLSRSALESLLTHSFPGNVRELENLLESVCALSSDDPQSIGEKELRAVLAQTSASSRDEVPLALEDMEKMAIERAVRLCSGNRTRAAALLGISRDTLYRKIRELKADGESL